MYKFIKCIYNLIYETWFWVSIKQPRHLFFFLRQELIYWCKKDV